MKLITKGIGLIIMSLICIASQLAMEAAPREEDIRNNLLTGKFVIRWAGCSDNIGKDLFLTFHEIKNEDCIVKAKKGVTPECVLTFRKNDQGYKIVHEKSPSETYSMYVTGKERGKREEKIVKFFQATGAGSYFGFYKPDPEYQQPNNVFFLKSDGYYVFVPNKWNGGDQSRDVKYTVSEDPRCLFYIEPYKHNYFKDIK